MAHPRRTAAALLLLGATLVATWSTTGAGVPRGQSLRRGNVTSDVSLSSAFELGKELFDANAKILGDSDDVDVLSGPAPGVGPMIHAPVEDLHDGNFCDDDEEMLGKLCYKKCSLLTDGKYPTRSTAWSCCAGGEGGKGKCGLFNQKMSPWICGGFDVSGDRAGNGCPHPAGACLDNEEVHLGRCYKKCSDLTDGKYPTRIAAATCCKSTEKWKCLDLRNVKTRTAFDVGGGKGDGDKRTPSSPHWPMREVTEQVHKVE